MSLTKKMRLCLKCLIQMVILGLKDFPLPHHLPEGIGDFGKILVALQPLVQKISVIEQQVLSGALDGFVKIYKAEGVKGWFTGVAATATRLSIGCAAQLTTFSKTKEMLLSKGFFQTSPFGLALASSAVSGIAIALVACPFDVAAVRLYNQSLSRKGQVLYTGVLDCLIKIYKTEGLYGFYKGIAPLYLKLAPNTTIPLVIWDVLNTLLHKNKNI